MDLFAGLKCKHIARKLSPTLPPASTSRTPSIPDRAMWKKSNGFMARLRQPFSSTESDVSFQQPSAIDVRRKCQHFRILVIGRTNAGKTTLLKKVCMSVEDPEIFGPDGQKIDSNVVEGSTDRGLHNIENQLIFKSNPEFIFHDSRGFESGSSEETNKVKDFIARRAAASTLEDQLHAIWYCLPTGDTTRPLLKADEDFFDTDIRGKVPVIAIFTKFDGLATRAFQELRDNGYSRSDSQQGKEQRAEQLLTTDFIEPLSSRKVPPSDYLRLADMHKDTTNCNELMEKTAKALTDDNLRLLFVSVQQNNINLCIQYAVGR
ncbi:GTP-binding protein [Mycena metata]|uniref:GTP-binding protein n=1 Tax=Mycena metata TaxID=1033252 RepID=A0AAD7J6F5_9AGAR|nr:GTP-binding protein [Mycena metata]